MNERELSLCLEELADRLESLCGTSNGDTEVIYQVVLELRKLSTEKYAPDNNMSWTTVVAPKKKDYYSQAGKRYPF